MWRLSDSGMSNTTHFSFPNVRHIDDRSLLLHSGVLMHVRPRTRGQPTMIRGGRFIAAASSGDGIATVNMQGVARTYCCRRVKFAAAPSYGRSWDSVQAHPYGFSWIDDSGSAWMSCGVVAHHEFAPPPGRRVVSLGAALHDGLVLLDDGSVRPFGDWVPRMRGSEFGRGLVDRHPAARAVAGSGDVVALLDPNGQLHFAGTGAGRMSSLLPTKLPQLTSIALGFGPRVAALDVDGRVQWFGEGGVDRRLLPPEMLEPGFVHVAVGQHWVAAIDGNGFGHAFGYLPGWEMSTDPLAGLLLAAKASEHAR